MCGIAGLFVCQAHKYSLDVEISRMLEALEHRGPDSDGVWVKSNIAFGHRRLAIQDLSPLGHQPMASPSGRYITAFNGEIYNFLELKSELEAMDFRFKGGSDTEVMLAAFDAWGIEEALCRFVGMFAFSLWDKVEQALFLARDRVGEKPLYYGWMQDAFIFSSELKALKEFSSWNGNIDRDALSLYVRHNYIPAPYSIYQGIKKLLPGSYLRLSIKGSDKSLSEHVYWSMSSVFMEGQSNLLELDSASISHHVEDILTSSIQEKMLSDVPLGAFLSGGIDSSLITALMQSVSNKPVSTFTIGFHEKEFDEADVARQVATHLGTEHSELYVSQDDAMKVIPLIPRMYDEPFSDSSQIPTYIVSQFAKNNVSVVLSGDGGDEFFGGYTRYLSVLNRWKDLQRHSFLTKNLMRGLIDKSGDFPYAFFNVLFNLLGKKGGSSITDRARRRMQDWRFCDLQSFYRHSMSYWYQPERVVIGGRDAETFLSNPTSVNGLVQDFKALMCLDAGSYLPDDILTKVDRATMAVSLEARVPLLDHRLIEYSARIPAELHVNNGQGKQLLRNILYKYVPRELIDRPKRGFAVPISAWLRGGLREWAESLLDPAKLHEQGLFHVAPIRQKWDEHLSGDYDWSFYLWGILMFQAWLENE